MASVITRGYNAMPPIEEITKIESVIIVDNEIPGGIGGTPSNYLCVIGEFTDMTQAIQVSSAGLVTENFRADYALSPSDFADKFGGFDSTIGNFGASMGNGFIEVAGKVYGTQRLLCLPVKLCSDYAGRMWRQLPTNKSASDPSPAVPLVAVTVPAGYEFKSSTNRVRTAVKKTFTADAYYSSGTDGAGTTASAAVTRPFDAPSGDFLGATTPSRKVYAGDFLVVGVVGAAGTLGSNADTFRIVSVTDGDTIVVEKLDGTAFDWVTATGLPWRIHPGGAGDTDGRSGTSATAGFSFTNAAGYKVAARPLDATISAATVLSPTVPPPAATGATWDALSGLKFATHPTQPLTYTAAIQAPNAAASASIDALYQNALKGLEGDREPQTLIGGIECARKSSTIALAMRQHCQTSFAAGHPRVAFISPPVNTLTAGAATALTYPGVEPMRDRRVFYYWPGVRVLPIVAAVGVGVATSDGSTTVDGSLDVTMDGYAAALFTRLAPEDNPGKPSEPVPSTFATIVDYARGVLPPDAPTYQLLKSRGIAAVKVDSGSPQIQSAVNTRLPTSPADPRSNQNQVVFSDYADRSLAAIGAGYNKELDTDDQKDALKSDVNGFLQSLGPPGSGVKPQRIKACNLTDITVPAEEDLGVVKLKVDIKMLPSIDFLVFSLTAGTTVKIEQVGV